MRLAASLLAALVPAVATAAEVSVRVAEGRVDVRAAAAPLTDVLDRLARQTGMKVLYEGSMPRPLLSLSLERRTPAEAVFAILEGLGLNYALQLDATGTQVVTLVMTGAAAPGASSARAAAPAARTLPPPMAYPDAVEQDDGMQDLDEEEANPQVPPQLVPPPGPVGLPTPGPSPSPTLAPVIPGFQGLTGPGYSPPVVNPFAPATPFGVATPVPVAPPTETEEKKPDS